MPKIGAYSGNTILGIGDNEDQAIAEAEGFILDWDYALADGGVKTAPVSEALLDEIIRTGFPFDTGNIPVILGPDGILWLEDGEGSFADDMILDLDQQEIPY